MSIRPVKRIVSAQPTMEGAGVHLHRGFGFGETAETDPFLLFYDFRGDDPRQYQAGFPWHPHRGIETITYVLAGNVEHADSLGNRGMLGAGDVQWMTAGRGIIHHEMPHGDPQGRMHGFQLWANLRRCDDPANAILAGLVPRPATSLNHRSCRTGSCRPSATSGSACPACRTLRASRSPDSAGRRPAPRLAASRR